MAVENPVGIRFFGVLQGIFLFALIVLLYVQFRRNKDRDEATAMKLDEFDLRTAVKRTPVAAQSDFVKDAGTHSRHEPEEDKEKQSKRSQRPPQLGSAFPSWTQATPAHEILGVHPQAGEEVVEAAYKALLKRYHPDRYAHWGKGYQTRAHHVVLLLQEARDRMLGKKK
ncbi:MAG: DnaJ domain-containing protein [Bdellovibrionota bacterium]